MNSDGEGTTKNLAYCFIGLYAVALIIIALVAAFKEPDSKGNQAWLDLLKSGFLLLGGGLTSIIGYYFGSRGTEKAQQVATIAKERYEELEHDLQVYGEEVAPTVDESSLIPKID